MKVKELKPILEVLDDDAEVEFTIVNHSREPKNEFHKPKKEFRDNYRTCRPYIFGHATSIKDPSGLNVGQSMTIIQQVWLVISAKQVSSHFATRITQELRIKSVGNEFLVLNMNFLKQLVISFVKSMTATEMSFKLFSH